MSDPATPPPEQDPASHSEAAKQVEDDHASAPELEHEETDQGPLLPGPAATPRPRPVAVPHHVPPAVPPAGPASVYAPSPPPSPYAPGLPPPRANAPQPYGVPPRVRPAAAFAPPVHPRSLEEWADKIPVAPPDPDTVRLQLPPHRNKIERISDHVTGIVDDVKALTQLSADFVQAKVATVQAKVHEMQQRIEKAQFLIESGWLFGVLALCALLLFVLMAAFGMSALAEKLFFDGRYLLSLMVGFASTAVLLILIGIAHMLFMRRRLLAKKQAKAELGKAQAKQQAHDSDQP